MNRKLFPPALFFLASILLCAISVRGQEENPEKSKLYYTADATRFRRNPDDTFVKELMGNVRARHLDTNLKADNGVYTSNPSELRFFGNAVLKDSIRQIEADTLVYREKTREAFALGNVRITEKNRSMLTSRVYYQKERWFLSTEGSVKIHEDSLKADIFGLKAEFDDSTGIGYVIGDPILTKTDSTGGVLTITASDTLKLVRDQKTAEIWNTVFVSKDSMKAFSKRAFMDDEKGIINLLGEPKIQYLSGGARKEKNIILRTETNVSGDTIRVFLKDRKVSRAEVIGKANDVTASSDSTGALFDRTVIESAYMNMTMENNQITHVSAEGTAQSYYRRNEKEKDRVYVNTATGDTLTFFFENGKVKSMKIFGYGGGLGKGKYLDFAAASDSATADSSKVKPEKGKNDGRGDKTNSRGNKR